MPSSPKIPKEIILKNALDMLIQDGYSSINIKSLAKRISPHQKEYQLFQM